MKKLLIFFLFLNTFFTTHAQFPVSLSSSEILLRLKKLNVLGSVLYIAAHPDDENTRLLAYLANEKLYRTGYLSITRGDGGQNLIGDEQGIELGLIRTQELLAARRIDGAEQFFTRAYDFGFSKKTEEALQKWNKDLILSDVVWVIRKFQPDVIITRFPEDSRAGHGHHSASAVLAHEAFLAAADPTRFPEQLNKGVAAWHAKRIVWNTFNFGSANTQSESQFKIDVGGYNALLGKGYGEIAAESRSQHKSQGFGVSAQRGTAWEYFVPVAGENFKTDLMDGVDTSWKRTANFGTLDRLQIPERIERIISGFSFEHPEKSVPELVILYKIISDSNGLSPYWKRQKLGELQNIIQACSGLFFEATTDVPYVVGGDSFRININLINRSNLHIGGRILYPFNHSFSGAIPSNQQVNYSQQISVPVNSPLSQPYWLRKGLNGAHYEVDDQQLIGMPENPPPYEVSLSIKMENQEFLFYIPVQYKFTDPVRGEVHQPLSIVPALSLMESPRHVFTRLNRQPVSPVKLNTTGYASSLRGAGVRYFQYAYKGNEIQKNHLITDTALTLNRNDWKSYLLNTGDILKKTGEKELHFYADLTAPNREPFQNLSVQRIIYSHIPTITYFYWNEIKVIKDEIITAGKNVGYIVGAGDKVPEALQEMGYNLTFLNQNDIVDGSLDRFDAIVTGVRAYNVNSWLDNVYEKLMNYVKNGGNLVVQYNTVGFSGLRSNKMAPFSFEITRGRVTDETAAVHFLHPKETILNWPNKISAADFDGWIQERGLYFAGNADKTYKSVLGMNDPGEGEQRGSLLVAQYGRGRFVYTGLAFFRQLPAGIGGAYRLFANLVANPNLQK